MYTSSRWRHTRAMASASLMRPTHSRRPLTLRNTSHIIKSPCCRTDIGTPMRVSWMAQPSVVVLIARLIGLGSLVIQSSVVQSFSRKTTRVKGKVSHTIPSPSLSHQNSRLHIHTIHCRTHIFYYKIYNLDKYLMKCYTL